MLEYLNLRKMK